MGSDSQTGEAPLIPIVAFTRAMRRRPDPLALAIVTVVALFAAAILGMPASVAVRTAAMGRFHLSGWPIAAWAIAQPLPSMYNFENHWEVSFSGATSDDCRSRFRGFLNHHVFSGVVGRRAVLERCGLPADVVYRSTYRGTTVETRYRITHGPGTHGLVVTPVRPQ
jgi:hypothetical protein